MAHAYTPGLQITGNTRLTRVRELPLPGRELVKVGAIVRADQEVLSAELPGELEILRIADRLAIDPEDVASGLKVTVGDVVEEKQLLCQVKSFFGLFTSELHSPLSGTVEFFTPANGHLGIRRSSLPMSVRAYVDGRIVEIDPGHSVTVETDAAILQGIFGVGGEQLGTILVLDVAPDAEVNAETITRQPRPLKNAILIGGACFTSDALAAAAQAGVAAVVTGSINAETLHRFVGHEIGVSITGDEDVPFSLIVTEGFGNLPLSNRALILAKQLDGKRASANGMTQVRAGAVRPEIIVPHAEQRASLDTAPDLRGVLDINAAVRIIRVPYFGQLGTVVELPHEPQLIATGARVRVARIRLQNNTEVVIPRANLELL